MCFHYLQWTINIWLLYPKRKKQDWLAMQLEVTSLTHTKKNQKSGMCLHVKGSSIFWCSQKQMLVATSSNHAKVITFMKQVANVWEWSSWHILHSQKWSFLCEWSNYSLWREFCLKEEFIKSDGTKHIHPKKIFQQDLEKEISTYNKFFDENSTDLFMKALLT